MKTILISIALFSSGLLHAQTLRSVDGRVATLPSQFVVSNEGIRWIPQGAPEAILIKWERIDLTALSKDEPKIEEARQKALLTKKEIFFSVPPKPNYYKEFLAQPINVKFKEKWKATTAGRSTYDVSTNGYIDYNTGAHSSNSQIKGQTSESTKFIDQTRPALNTTVQGLLIQLSDDGRLDTHKLIQDLRDSGAVLQNVRDLFTNLSAAYPQDIEITRTIAALDRLMAERTTSVDAMRQLGRFAIYAQNKAK